MKFTLVLLIVAAVVGCTLSCSDGSWDEFKKTYDKKYGPEEDLRRRDVYCENLKTIEQHNENYRRGHTTYTLGVNKFSDWTQEEFNAFVGQGLRQE